jgi:L-threonylcarbamoyladenylate synthase
MPATLRIRTDQLTIASDILRRGGTVAFPTETVYGLGADALNANAINKIFVAKGRPSDNPLIVHIASLEQLDEVAQDRTPLANKLVADYWPGPLTIVLRNKGTVPRSVTAGLDTVAVRMPIDPIACELIRLADRPIVAPSANKSGRPSATTWQAVLDDLDGLIDGVVCGPQTTIGVESTVVDATGDAPIILRHGAITQEMIAKSCGNLSLATPELQNRSPGTRHPHYQPSAGVVLFDNFEQIDPSESTIGIIGYCNEPLGRQMRSDLQARFPQARIMLCGSLEEYANRLFEFFRCCDRLGLGRIYCQRVKEEGFGRAIRDRLDRAAR